MPREELDWLERRLAGAEATLPDAGFTLRVMSALPARPASRRIERNDWILLGGAAIGSAAVAAQFPLVPFVKLLIESSQVTWVGGLAMLACMAGVLLYEPLRNSL